MSESGTGRQLGHALRNWRDRIAPDSVGLPARRGRRAPGLRREELATLAGISTDYLIRLEQGRSTTPSRPVTMALARALRLSAAERRHLFLLAGQAPPAEDRIPAHLTPGIQRLLDQMTGDPVGVYNATWTLLAWNSLFSALFGDPSAQSGRERNVAWRHFTGQPSRVSHTPEQRRRFEAAVVADLREASARYPIDPDLHTLVSDLRAASDTFERLWETHEVGKHTTDVKTIEHPYVGPLELNCDVLTAPDDNLYIVIHTATPGSDAAGKLRLLDVIGTQNMTETHRGR
ncbi:helix-turn-helix transcriptional regulator [Amycolatopsis aidingensis]|uniref:helix-turn-helix transcriptional regulator n=1 Tax=Amycolatopsis aidingensis TaxID=2842453 RepID=UPI001C0AA6AD|nr:helix-turn-helix transcriptional regulator [Amycolatopsis aidingensis]